MTSWRLGLTPDQMREVDRLAEADFGIAPIQLMEVAGLQTARVAREMLGPDLGSRAVCILAGKGNNGADGMVAARRLAGWGASVRVLTSFAVAEASGLGAVQATAANAAGVAVEPWSASTPAAELYIDALLGFGAAGAPRGVVAEMIEWLNALKGARVLALDLPSGLDAATGDTPGGCARATTTITLAAPKCGMLQREGRQVVGDLFVADIGIPPALLRVVGVDPRGLFESSDLQRY